MRRITLLTDFGTVDGYVAAMKGVIADIAPAAPVDDAVHDIPPGDIHAAAFTLGRYWHLYPPGTIHMIVVDPGVGSGRRAIAARADERLLVAPDNGVLTRVFEDASPAVVVALENEAFHRPTISATFHGRDVFAPVAAHLAAGAALEELGPTVMDPASLEFPPPERTAHWVYGEILHVDRFGNLISNIPAEWVANAEEVRVAGRQLGGVRQTYADVEPGAVLTLIGSLGLLEVSVRDGSAAVELGVGRGTEVRVRT